MSVYSRVLCVIFLTACVRAGEPSPSVAEPWASILEFMKNDDGQANAALTEHLKSLSGPEMLLAARQACGSVAPPSREMRDMPPEAVAEFYVMTCLKYYFDKTGRDEGGAILLRIIADPEEPPLLRRTLISRMHERDVPFDGEFQDYVAANEKEASDLLMTLVKERAEDPSVRKQAMRCLASRLAREVRRIIRSDPNAQAALERTHSFSEVAEMIRSGELTLTDETQKAMEPLQTRTRTFVQALGAILADAREGEEIRADVRRRVEGYQTSSVAGIPAEAKKALKDAVD